jgi:hypothetical protein
MPTATITPLPTAPSRADPANFAARGDAFMAALPVLVTEINAVLPNIDVAVATSAAANAAVSAAGAASSAALAAAVASGSVGDYPTLCPTLLLDFANGQALDARITFTRASTATRVNARGLVETLAANMPRFDFDPVTLACRGLLVEEQRTNLLTYSEQFDHANWGAKINCTVTANAATAPDGNATADALTRTATGNHYIAQGYTTTSHANKTFTFSVWVKAGTLTGDVALIIKDNSSTVAGIEIFTPSSTWQRCSVTGTFGASPAANISVFIDPGNDTGSAGDTLLLWGAQLEEGAFVSSYIPTTSAAATRSADLALMTGTNFSSWYNQSEGTLLAEHDLIGYAPAAAFPGVARVYDAAPNNGINLSSANTASLMFPSGSSTTAGATDAGYYGASLTAAYGVGAVVASVIAVKLNDGAFTAQGLAVQTDSSVVVPAVITLAIGSLGISGQLNGHVRRLAYYPKRLPNTQLQALTAP